MTDERKDDHDDELGLDESLSSMRSMWREMKDEEPSDKGMAALLAAAREKAEEMKPKRSWLAALLDQLRRPPVLAMATVVVLIGGAVVISQRKDDLKTESEIASGPTAGDDKTAAPAPANDGVVVGGLGAQDNLAEGRERWAAPGSAAPVAEPPPPEMTKQETVRRPKPKLDAAKKSTVAMTPTETKPDPVPEKPAEKAEAKKDSTTLQIAAGDEDDMQPKGSTEATSVATPTAPPADHKPVLRKPLPSIEGEDRAAKDSTVAQLIKQCEAAAAKNDCAAVRSIAAKIAQQDPQTYRSRLVKNAKVARCLEPSPPMEAAPIQADE